MEKYYKKKSLSFGKDVRNRELRSMRMDENRSNASYQRLSVIRKICDDESTKPSTTNNSKNIATPVDPRRTMLRKWQEERRLKKELEKRDKKPIFKVSHICNVVHPGANMGKNRNVLKALPKTSEIPRAVSSKGSRTVQKKTVDFKDSKFKQLSEPQTKKCYQNADAAKLKHLQPTKFSSGEVPFQCNISFIDRKDSRSTSFAPESFAFKAPAGLEEYSLMADSITGVYLKHEAKMNVIPMRSTPKNTTELRKTESDLIKAELDLDNKMSNNSKECSTPSALVQDSFIGEHSTKLSVVPLNLGQIFQEIEQSLEYKVASKSDNLLRVPEKDISLKELDTTGKLLEVAATAEVSRRNFASFTPRRSERLAPLSSESYDSSTISIGLLQDVDDSVVIPRESHTGLTLDFGLMQVDTPTAKQNPSERGEEKNDVWTYEKVPKI